ncbi:MAG: DNA repair protein RadA, partial [Pseudomonadota bacterium]
MARPQSVFTCSECGAVHKKWTGRCDGCGAWNSVSEDAGLSTAGPASRTLGAEKGQRIELHSLSGTEAAPPRASFGVAELDRVLGGGLAAASAVLLGGDPGIGKSTILLQA